MHILSMVVVAAECCCALRALMPDAIMAASNRHVGISTNDKNCSSCSVELKIVRMMMHYAREHTNVPTDQGWAVLMMIPRTEQISRITHVIIETSTDMMIMKADNIFIFT